MPVAEMTDLKLRGTKERSAQTKANRPYAAASTVVVATIRRGEGTTSGTTGETSLEVLHHVIGDVLKVARGGKTPASLYGYAWPKGVSPTPTNILVWIVECFDRAKERNLPIDIVMPAEAK